MLIWILFIFYAAGKFSHVYLSLVIKSNENDFVIFWSGIVVAASSGCVVLYVNECLGEEAHKL